MRLLNISTLSLLLIGILHLFDGFPESKSNDSDSSGHHMKGRITVVSTANVQKCNHMTNQNLKKETTKKVGKMGVLQTQSR